MTFTPYELEVLIIEHAKRIRRTFKSNSLTRARTLELVDKQVKRIQYLVDELRKTEEE